MTKTNPEVHLAMEIRQFAYDQQDQPISPEQWAKVVLESEAVKMVKAEVWDESRARAADGYAVNPYRDLVAIDDANVRDMRREYEGL